jgi:hypothetical protein
MNKDKLIEELKALSSAIDGGIMLVNQGKETP